MTSAHVQDKAAAMKIASRIRELAIANALTPPSLQWQEEPPENGDGPFHMKAFGKAYIVSKEPVDSPNVSYANESAGKIWRYDVYTVHAAPPNYPKAKEWIDGTKSNWHRGTALQAQTDILKDIEHDLYSYLTQRKMYEPPPRDCQNVTLRLSNVFVNDLHNDMERHGYENLHDYLVRLIEEGVEDMTHLEKIGHFEDLEKENE